MPTALHQGRSAAFLIPHHGPRLCRRWLRCHQPWGSSGVALGCHGADGTEQEEVVVAHLLGQGGDPSRAGVP